MRIEGLRDHLSQFPDIDGFWNFEDFSETESKIRVLLSQEEHSRSPRLVELLTQLARVQGLQDKLPEAGATLLLAKDLISKQDAKVDRTEMRFLIEQGRFFGLSMNPAQSLAYFEKAWEASLKLDEVFFSIEAAVLLSISQPPKHQNKWLQKAIELAETTSDERGKRWLSQLYVMNGWHSFDFRKFEEAFESFEKALTQPQTDQDVPKILAMKWAKARTLRALNRVQEALDMQRGLAVEFQAMGKVNGHVFLEMAECFQLLKNNEEAKTHFESAYKELSLNGWYSNNKSLELSRIQHLSKKR